MSEITAAEAAIRAALTRIERRDTALESGEEDSYDSDAGYTLEDVERILRDALDS